MGFDNKVVGGPYIFISTFDLTYAEKKPIKNINQPSTFALVRNFPNPFNTSTTIRYSLDGSGLAELEIFSTPGQKVRTLFSENRAPGIYNTIWDGKNDQGSPVSSGVYIARLKMNGQVESRRMTLVK
ncbi:MAG: T9SS type A sorting domain-containing protein [Candidatus Latescibacterota bacterium]